MRKKSNRKKNVTEGSGNVFEDMGFANAREEYIRAHLTARISMALQERGLTQKEAAKMLGIDQPKVSALKNGRFTGFSVERLLSFLLALGNDIDISIKPRANRKRLAEIHIHATP